MPEQKVIDVIQKGLIIGMSVLMFTLLGNTKNMEIQFETNKKDNMYINVNEKETLTLEYTYVYGNDTIYINKTFDE
jgi:hypothetical protein